MIISWVLFGLTSSLILVESSIPSNASGKHSFSFSEIFANIINFFSKPKEVTTLDPESLTVSVSDPTAKVDGVTKTIVDTETAVVGTTKMFSYKLNFPKKETDVYNSDVTFKCISSPGDNSYTSSISSSTKSGTVRIIPLLEGSYTFELKDKAEHTRTFSFEAVKRIKTSSISSSFETISLDKGQYKYFPYAFTFGDLKRSDTSTDHYLQRFYDRSLTEFTSSDESIFEVSNGGVLRGVSMGTADLLYKGESVCEVNVSDTSFTSGVDHISITSSKEEVSPLDFDYPTYGTELEVHYYDSLNQEIVSDEPVSFSSDDYLVAMVDNDHQEIINDTLTDVKGGHVYGYRKLGSTNIRASLCSNPSVNTSIEITSKRVNPTSAVITAKSGKTTLVNDSSNSLVAGNTISLSRTFEPKNASNTELRVEVADSSVLEVQNNNTTSPSINILKDGNTSFSVYMPSIGEESKVTYELSISPMPKIDDKDMSKFHQLIRKGIGHFTLFLVDAIFAFFAFTLTFFKKKKWWVSLSFSLGLLFVTGFALAGFSELIQSIPKLHRSALWSDVLIDFTGFSAGIVICSLGYLSYKLVKYLILKKKNT